MSVRGTLIIRGGGDERLKFQCMYDGGANFAYVYNNQLQDFGTHVKIVSSLVWGNHQTCQVTRLAWFWLTFVMYNLLNRSIHSMTSIRPHNIDTHT